MEEISKNIARIVELLAVSQTGNASEWDQSNVEKAFQWSNYCEQVCRRNVANRAFILHVESSLKQTNMELQRVFANYNNVTLDDLQRCTDVLLRNLLKNPTCPCSVLSHVLGDLKPNAGSDNNNVRNCFSDLHRSDLLTFLIDTSLARKTGVLKVETQVRGLIFYDYIHKRLSNSSSESIRPMRQVLDSFAGSSIDISAAEVIASAVLSRDNLSLTDGTLILSWLQTSPHTMLAMCQALSVPTLAELAYRSEQFRLAYMEVLKQWALALIYDVTVGKWLPESTTPVSFTTLTEHFRVLLSKGQSVETETLRELHELKECDGGFDERGLSIWGDILTELIGHGSPH